MRKNSLHIHTHFMAVPISMNLKNHLGFVLIQDAILSNLRVIILLNVL